VSAVPATHVFPLQQPPGHVAGLHGGVTQAWPVHVWPPAAQSLHAPPPIPHAASLVPATQMFPLQQPPGHVAALQPGTPQVFAPEQTCPSAEQLEHVSPFPPHKVS